MSEAIGGRQSGHAGVIRAAAVQHVAHTAWLTEGTTAPSGTMTVVPIVADGEVAGIEVRCRCGESVLIECVYEENEA